MPSKSAAILKMVESRRRSPATGDWVAKRARQRPSTSTRRARTERTSASTAREKIASALEAEAHDLLGLAEGQVPHSHGVRLETVQRLVELRSGHGWERVPPG